MNAFAEFVWSEALRITAEYKKTACCADCGELVQITAIDRMMCDTGDCVLCQDCCRERMEGIA